MLFRSRGSAREALSPRGAKSRLSDGTPRAAKGRAHRLSNLLSLTAFRSTPSGFFIIKARSAFKRGAYGPISAGNIVAPHTPNASQSSRTSPAWSRGTSYFSMSDLPERQLRFRERRIRFLVTDRARPLVDDLTMTPSSESGFERAIYAHR